MNNLYNRILNNLTKYAEDQDNAMNADPTGTYDKPTGLQEAAARHFPVTGIAGATSYVVGSGIDSAKRHWFNHTAGKDMGVKVTDSLPKVYKNYDKAAKRQNSNWPNSPGSGVSVTGGAKNKPDFSRIPKPSVLARILKFLGIAGMLSSAYGLYNSHKYGINPNEVINIDE